MPAAGRCEAQAAAPQIILVMPQQCVCATFNLGCVFQFQLIVGAVEIGASVQHRRYAFAPVQQQPLGRQRPLETQAAAVKKRMS